MQILAIGSRGEQREGRFVPIATLLWEDGKTEEFEIEVPEDVVLTRPEAAFVGYLGARAKWQAIMH